MTKWENEKLCQKARKKAGFIKKMLANKEKRKFIRVGIRQLTSIILNEKGNYELIEESSKATPVAILIHDISLGGACITLDQELKVEALIDLEIPKIGELDATVINCEVARSVFKLIETQHLYEVGFQFKNRNIEYLKKFIELAKTNGTSNENRLQI